LIRSRLIVVPEGPGSPGPPAGRLPESRQLNCIFIEARMWNFILGYLAGVVSVVAVVWGMARKA
jgi:hypothetical protein